MSEEEKQRRIQLIDIQDVCGYNIGVPIVIVVNKTDAYFPKYQEKKEFISKHLRKFAVTYGATLIYTSSKKRKNISVLYNYILHILLNNKLINKSNSTNIDEYYFPSGADRLSVIKGNDTNNYLEYDYKEMIPKFEEKTETDEKEEECDEQKFLKELLIENKETEGSSSKKTLKMKESNSNMKSNRKITSTMAIIDEKEEKKDISKFTKFGFSQKSEALKLDEKRKIKLTDSLRGSYQKK